MAAVSPDISTAYDVSYPDVAGLGGPVYVQIGEKVPIRQIGHDPSRTSFKNSMTEYIDVAYPDSSKLQFYYYRQP